MWRLMGAGALACLVAGAWAAPESGVQAEYFDHGVKPQDDFYRHVNGRWLASTEIPADKSGYSAFTEISDRTEEQLRVLIEAAAADEAAADGSAAQKIGDMYRSFMAEQRANALGLQPLQADLRQIDRLGDHAGIPDLMAALERIGVDSLIGGWVGRDKKQPDRYTVYLYQAGLGLPDRDYYLEDNAKFTQLRAAYQDYLSKLLRKAGTIDADAYAKQILALETRIAGAHWTRVQSRDAQQTYNPVALAQINRDMGGWDARRYLRAVGVHSIDQVIVYQPSFFATLGDILRETPVDVWREYFRSRLITAYAPYLSQDLVDLHFDFHRRTLSGVDEPRPRWKRGVATVEDGLGELLGQLYVDRHFPPRAKQRMQAMVDNLIGAYQASIRELDWMGEATKAQALKKLAAFKPKIGYPDQWKDYSALSISPDDLVGNIRRARRHGLILALDKLGSPIDPHEWHMTPQTVNAYYSPTANEIVFPAAILQPPFFNLAADDAVNYGAIGAVIGHEIGHGFDDQGSRYDGEGRLHNWWTDADRERFEQRTQMLISQFGDYEPLPGHKLNGQLTIGENIGDLGGLSIAAKAYQLSLQGRSAPELDGYTGMQRLLIGWAQIWRQRYREKALLRRVKTDPHSPGEFRCNGIVANLPQFYRAFGVEPDHQLYRPPEQRVKIW